MARIASVVLPSDKEVWIGLTYIYGIGRTTAKAILAEAKIEPTTRVKDLTEADEQKINDIISSKYQVEGDLKRLVTNNIKRIKDINSYKGVRHKAGLPVNGQRTRTNARTRKGKATRFSKGKHAYPGTTYRRDRKYAYVTLAEGNKIRVFDEETVEEGDKK